MAMPTPPDWQDVIRQKRTIESGRSIDEPKRVRPEQDHVLPLAERRHLGLERRALRVGLLEACADDDDVPHARLCALAQARQHAAAVHGDDRMRHALRHLEDGGIARPAPERPVLRVYIEDRAAEAVGDAAAEAAADLAGLFARADDGHGRRTEQRIRDCLHTAAPPNTIL